MGLDMVARRWTRLFLALLWLLADCSARASYTEQLTLRALPSIDQVLARFRFSVHESAGSSTDGLFPTVLRHVLDKYNAESLHLTLATGRYTSWRYGSAQSSPTDALAHAPFGARLQVALRSDTDSDDDMFRRWKGLTSELGGIFSASLGQMDTTVTTEPLPGTSALALGAFPGLQTPQANSLHFIHGSLAREELCSENLMPWLKLLPCRAVSGLGAIIEPIKALSGEYLSLSLRASRSAEGGWTLQQDLTTVQGPTKRNKARWSLASLFLDSATAAGELDACPLATTSAIYTEDAVRAPVDLLERPISLSEPWFSDWKAAESDRQTQQDVVSAHRFVTGHGQVHGGLAVQLRNAHPSCSLRVTYYDVIPWYLRLYLHTSHFTAVSASGQAQDADGLVQRFDFVPAELRGRPSEIRLEAHVAANSSLVLSVDMDKVFLRLSEYPPDASRGFDVAPGVATFQFLPSSFDDAACGVAPSSGEAATTTVFTEPLLVLLPTPDFSMPYNVITMTSTVVAFFVGSMLNTLLRKAPRLKQMMAKPSAELAK